MECRDDELVIEVKRGDRKAFDKLVRRYKDKMFSLAYRMTGERETALDIVQDTFFSAFSNINKFRADSSFSSWLYRIASNKALNFLKRKRLLTFIPLADRSANEPVYDTSDSAERHELAREIALAINDLPAKQKLTFNLRYYEQMPFGEIAAILDKSESTVKTNYKKAIEKLRRKLKNFR